MTAENLFAAFACDERIQHGRLAIVNRDRKTVTLDVKGEVLPHNAEADQSNFCTCHCFSITPLNTSFSFARPRNTSFPRSTRTARLPCFISDSKSPNACASLSTLKLYGAPGTAKSI